MRLEAFPAVVEPDRRILGEGNETDADETLGHLDQVWILGGQAENTQPLPIDVTLIGRVQRAL